MTTINGYSHPYCCLYRVIPILAHWRGLYIPVKLVKTDETADVVATARQALHIDLIGAARQVINYHHEFTVEMQSVFLLKLNFATEVKYCQETLEHTYMVTS